MRPKSLRRHTSHVGSPRRQTRFFLLYPFFPPSSILHLNRPRRPRRRRRRRCCSCPHKTYYSCRCKTTKRFQRRHCHSFSVHAPFSKQPQSLQLRYRQQHTSTLLRQPHFNQRMPHIDTRNAYHNAPPPPQPQPTGHRPQHTQWHPHNLVNNAMSNPFRESLPYFPTIPSSYYVAHHADHSRTVLGFILFSAAVAVFLSRRRMRNWISRMVSQAIEAANVPSLHIHIHGQSSSNDYIAVPDSPMSPMFPPFSPFTQTAS